MQPKHETLVREKQDTKTLSKVQLFYLNKRKKEENGTTAKKNPLIENSTFYKAFILI